MSATPRRLQEATNTGLSRCAPRSHCPREVTEVRTRLPEADTRERAAKGLEAAAGVEPANRGFADLRLSHLATPPSDRLYGTSVGRFNMVGRVPGRSSRTRRQVRLVLADHPFGTLQADERSGSRRGSRPPARDGRRSRGRDRALPGRGSPDDEHPGAELPHNPGRATRGRACSLLTRSTLAVILNRRLRAGIAQW